MRTVWVLFFTYLWDDWVLTRVHPNFSTESKGMNVSSMLNSLPREQTGDDKNGTKEVVITMITTDKDNQKTRSPFLDRGA